MRNHPSILLRTLRQLDIVPAAPGERPFVAAASGLCEVDGQLFIVADDEHTLAVFPAAGSGPGARFGLLRPGSSERAQLPKALKPDLEALCVLPGDLLLALPSGSSPTRHLGPVISLRAGQPVIPARILDFAPLFERLDHELPSLNLEGAAVIGSSLWLAQRGNTTHPSALVELALAAVAGSEVPASALRRVVPLALGDLDGVPFTPTDLCPLPDGRLIVSAVCEDTADRYNDGACTGAAIAIVTPGQPPSSFARLEPTFKVEGLSVRSNSVVWMVCDADDPARAAVLLEGKLHPG